MSIESIINEDVVSITNCESEPIHIPGSIQPHGFLLAVTVVDFTIAYCSENCFEFLNKTHVELVGIKLEDFFAIQDVINIEQQFHNASQELA